MQYTECFGIVYWTYKAGNIAVSAGAMQWYVARFHNQIQAYTEHEHRAKQFKANSMTMNLIEDFNINHVRGLKDASLYTLFMPGWHSELECWLGSMLTNAL